MKSSTFKSSKLLETLPLPLELRRRVFYFAVIEPHPLPLFSHRDCAGRIDGYAIEKDLRMVATCKDFHNELKDMLYSQSCFSASVIRNEAEKGATLFQVELKRI